MTTMGSKVSRVLPLPLREGVGGRGRCGGSIPLPLPPSRKGRGRAFILAFVAPLSTSVVPTFVVLCPIV
jgi:hypothetical protein